MSPRQTTVAPVPQALPDLTSRIKRLEVVPLALLDPLSFGNPRAMDPADHERLRHAIREVGYVEPMVVREAPGAPGRYEILDGHHRYEVLVEEGVSAAQVVVVDLDDVRARAQVLSSGNIRARWTDELQNFIAGMLADGAEPEWLTALSGFSAADVPALAVAGAGFLDEFAPPEAPEAMGEPESAKAPTAGRVPFNAHLLPPENETVQAAMRAAKKKGAGTTPEALVRICAAYLDSTEV